MAASCFTACGGSDSRQDGGKVVIRGSTSVEPLMNKLIDEYKKSSVGKYKIDFDIDCQGSSAGITAAKADTSAGNVIGMSSSALKSTDTPDLANDFNIALDAVAIIVHKNNSIDEISIQELYEIFNIKYGTMRKWEDITDEVEEVEVPRSNVTGAIEVVIREAGSGTRDAFDGLIKNEAGDSLAKLANGTAITENIFPGATEENSTNNVLNAIKTNAKAIGYISLGSVNSDVKVLKVKANASGSAIEPKESTVLDNTYKLQRPFVIFTGKATLTDGAADFMKFLKSTQAQTIVQEQKFVKQETGKVAYTK